MLAACLTPYLAGAPAHAAGEEIAWPKRLIVSAPSSGTPASMIMASIARVIEKNTPIQRVIVQPIGGINNFAPMMEKGEVDIAIHSGADVLAHMAGLKAYCREKLLAMGGVVPVGEGTAPHILAVSLVGYPSANIVTDLGAQGICISAGSACHQGKASHVVSALGLDKKTAAGVIRISFSPDNTEADVDALCHALKSHRDSRFPML